MRGSSDSRLWITWAALDHTLEILKDAHCEHYTQTAKDCIRKVVLYLMALRHVYLDGEHYQKMEVCKRDVLQKLRVIVGTPTKMLEARSWIK